ncbi:alpha/beta fold hydrolase [Prescottella soli]|uniref:Alpha/beta fold hydrolase n=1 Tax=Prescottella soli TaxID=1543852 RepID=A0ABW9FQQ2_9NOCA
MVVGGLAKSFDGASASRGDRRTLRVRATGSLVAAASVLLVWCTGSVGATASAASASASEDGGIVDQKLAWHPCPADVVEHALAGDGYAAARSAILSGLECARVRTPLDWAHPDDGRQASFWVSRLPGTHPGSGPLLTSSGGAGAGTLLDPYSFSGGMPELRNSFDLIGFDARGTSTSSTAQSCDPGISGDPIVLGTSARDGYDVLDTAGRSIDRQLDEARRWTAACLDRAAKTGDDASTAPYVNYWQTVRDLDLVRQLLGAPKWSYLGVSQGTALGRELARTFPDRVDRWVLDSVADPVKSPNDVLQERYRSRQRAVESEFAPWAAAQGTVLGDTATKVLSSIEQLRADLVVQPIQLLGGQRFTANNLNSVLFGVGNAANEAVLAKLVTIRSARSAGTSVASVQAAIGMFTQFQASPFIDRELGSVLAGGPRQGWWTAFNCNSADWSKDTDAILAEHREAAQDAPLTYLGLGFSAACAQWPYPGQQDPQTGLERVPGILLLTNQGDTVTPASGAHNLRDRIPGARLVTVESKSAHLVLPQRMPFGLPGGVPGTSSCATATATRYLTTGELPVDDQSCQPG